MTKRLKNKLINQAKQLDKVVDSLDNIVKEIDSNSPGENEDYDSLGFQLDLERVSESIEKEMLILRELIKDVE